MGGEYEVNKSCPSLSVVSLSIVLVFVFVFVLVIVLILVPELVVVVTVPVLANVRIVKSQDACHFSTARKTKQL